ncbi:hypothetical protein scyTo_0019869, partial [Scyliorhinus torazame]|nr:hypothetical protein [Scyliorhinus torazame]
MLVVVIHIFAGALIYLLSNPYEEAVTAAGVGNVSAANRPCPLSVPDLLSCLCRDSELSDYRGGFLYQKGTWKRFRLHRIKKNDTLPELDTSE